MDVSGGTVTIKESTAREDGGSGGMGRFLGPRTGNEGSPPQEVARRASWTLQCRAEVLRVQGLRGLQADATPAVALRVISNV